MLNTTFILTILQKEKPKLVEKFNIEKIGIFGSYATHTQLDNSDIDIYVEFKHGHTNFSNIAGLWNYLELLFHKEIDLVYYRNDRKDTIIKNIQEKVLYV